MNVHEDALQEAIAAAALADTPTEAVDAELTASTDDLNAASEELGAMSRQVENVGGLHESMESFVFGFMDRVPEGEWDGRVSRQYRVGINALMNAHGYTTKPDAISASFESAGVSQTNDENRKENKDKATGLLGRLWEALKAALASLGKIIVSYGSKIINNGFVVSKAAKSLRNSLTVLKDEVPSGDFEGKPAWGVYYQTKDGAASSASSIVHETPLEVNALLGGWDASFKSQIRLLAFPGHTDASVTVGGVKKFKISGGIQVEVEYVDEHLKGTGNKLAEATIKVSKAEFPTGKIPYLSKAEMHKVADAMDATATGLKNMAEQGKPIEQEIGKLLDELKKRTGDFKVTAKAGVEKGSDVPALAKSGKDQVAIVRKLISRYPMAMQVLAPQVAMVAMNAWRHCQASIGKARKGKSDDKEGMPVGA